MKTLFRHASIIFYLMSSIPSLHAVKSRLFDSDDDPERGDVPGWVMVTLMSALIVAALIAVAIPALTDMFHSAVHKIH